LVAILVGVLHVGGYGVRRTIPSVPRADQINNRWSAFHLHRHYSAWRATCRWIAESGEVPPDARFLTPRMAQTFKWYAGRSEVFCRKDVPQDAQGIVEWNERYYDIFRTQSEIPGSRWRTSLATIDSETLKQLADKYDFRYVVIDRTVLDPIGYHPDVIPVADNDSFKIFRLRDVRPNTEESEPQP